MPVKYIVVTGGVISGVGKGLTASGIGAVLKAHNVKVTSIKIDPYLNIDAGTFSPIEHGEVYVLDDGGEVDLDLGNYERFLDESLTRENTITTGKIYEQVINRERKGEFLGTTVQVVPHITQAIQDWIENVANKDNAYDVCVVELGGVVGDIEGLPFIEALRQMKYRLGSENFIVVHVSLLPTTNGELKTKPTQMSVKELRGLGLAPQLLICRAEMSLTEANKNKLSLFCQTPTSNIIEMLDCSCIYEIPIKLFEQNVCTIIRDELKLNIKNMDIKYLQKWTDLVNTYQKYQSNPLKIALVGKYMKLKDSYHSVERALFHSCLKIKRGLKICWIDSENLQIENQNSEEYKILWNELKLCDGIVIPGGFGSRGIEGKILVANYARIHKIPVLGICLGLQIMVIEACRNLLGYVDSNSTEFDQNTKNPVIIDMEEYNKEHLGASMRLGKHGTRIIDKNSKIYNLYGNNEIIYERHRHRFEVNFKYRKELEDKNIKFVGIDTQENQLEILDYIDHPYYVGVQFHPEFKSRPCNPSPLFLGLVINADKKSNII